jgi:hypothetical protein
MRHRRQIIVAGLATLATGLLPSFVSVHSSCLEDLAAQLAGVTEWLQVEEAHESLMRIHCGVRDVIALADRARGLAGPKSRIMAGGAELRFTVRGTPVCLILHLIS